jgi:hypothetical protein
MMDAWMMSGMLPFVHELKNCTFIPTIFYLARRLILRNDERNEERI